MNLNSLRALDALLRTGGVTAAARELGLSQSAVSHQLSALRQTFDDPLLVRSGSETLLTPRARALAAPLEASLAELERLVRSHVSFDPATTTHHFRVSVGQHLAAALLPRLVLALRSKAPGAQLSAREVPPTRVSEALARADTDLAIGTGEALHAAILTRPWLADEFACAVRAGHPAAEAPLTLDVYTALEHVMVSPTGKGTSPVDDMLAALGRTRRVAVRVDSFLIAPILVRESELIITAPRASLTPFVARHELVFLPVPLELEASKSVKLMWHEGRTDEPAHRWFRELVLGLAQRPTV